MAEVKVYVSKDGKKVITDTPYNKEFVEAAHYLSGSWNPADRVWEFKLDQKEKVEEAVNRIYHVGDKMIAVRYDLKKAFDLDDGNTGSTFQIAGINIARRVSRDWNVKLYGTIIIYGGFAARGGSMKYPTLDWDPDTILQSRLPESVVEKLDKDVFKIVD